MTSGKDKPLDFSLKRQKDLPPKTPEPMEQNVVSSSDSISNGIELLRRTLLMGTLGLSPPLSTQLSYFPSASLIFPEVRSRNAVSPRKSIPLADEDKVKITVG